MKLFGREVEGIPRLLVIFASVLLVASGLCGLQMSTVFGTRLGSSGFFEMTGTLELIAMVVSALVIVVLLLIWPILAIRDKLASRNPEVPSIFEKHDQKDQDKKENGQ